MKAVTNSCLILSVQLENANHQAAIDFSYPHSVAAGRRYTKGKGQRGERLESKRLRGTWKAARSWHAAGVGSAEENHFCGIRKKKRKKNEGGLSCKSTRKRINSYLGCIFWEVGMDSTKMLLSEYVGIFPFTSYTAKVQLAHSEEQ